MVWAIHLYLDFSNGPTAPLAFQNGTAAVSLGAFYASSKVIVVPTVALQLQGEPVDADAEVVFDLEVGVTKTIQVFPSTRVYRIGPANYVI